MSSNGKKKYKRSPFSKSNGSGEQCNYCRRTLAASTSSNSRLRATRDHVKPKCEGGQYRVWSCWECNQIKGGMPLEDWVFFMAHNPEWWMRPELARKVQSASEKLKSSMAFYAEYIE